MFKVGDKVKVVYNSNGSGIVKGVINKIGIIFKNPKNLGMIYVKFDEEVWGNLSIIGFYNNEIEKVNIKGQQLLFDFMDEVT